MRVHLISFSPFFLLPSSPFPETHRSSLFERFNLLSLPFAFPFSLYFTLRGSLSQNLRRYRPSSSFLIPNFHFFAIIFSTPTNIFTRPLFFIPDLCTDFPRSKSRVETQRGRDRSRKRNIIPRELFQIENGTRLSREKATATLARRIKLRCSFRENFTLLHFAGASGGGRESPIR